MSVNKRFEIALDLKHSISSRDFEVVDGDTGNELVILLTDGGAAVDLSACRVAAVFSTSRGIANQYSDDGTGGVSLGGTAGNEVTIELFSGSFAPGIVECELQVYSGSSPQTLVTSAKFNFTCRRGISNDETVTSKREYSILSQLIGSVEGTIATLNTSVQALLAKGQGDIAAMLSSASAEIQARLTAAESQMTSFIQQLETAAAHGASHASAGYDPITPAMIGAAPAVQACSFTLSSTGWSQSGEVFAYVLTGIAGMTENSLLLVGPKSTTSRPAAQALAAAGLYVYYADLQEGGGRVILRGTGVKPAENLDILLYILG